MSKKVKHALMAVALVVGHVFDLVGVTANATVSVGLVVNLAWLAEI